MPSPVPDFVTHAAELLAPLGPVRVKRMFGGFGFYVDEVFLALAIAEQLYLKVDATTRGRFEAAGCHPFVYDAKGKTVTVGYWTAPEEAMESAALMTPWARLAFDSALRARRAAPTRRARAAAR